MDNDVLEGSLQPQQAGSVQSVSFVLNQPAKCHAYFVALRAFDKVENAAKVSNLARFFVNGEPKDCHHSDKKNGRKHKPVGGQLIRTTMPSSEDHTTAEVGIQMEETEETLVVLLSNHKFSVSASAFGLFLIVGLLVVLVAVILQMLRKRRHMYKPMLIPKWRTIERYFLCNPVNQQFPLEGKIRFEKL